MLRAILEQEDRSARRHVDDTHHLDETKLVEIIAKLGKRYESSVASRVYLQNGCIRIPGTFVNGSGDEMKAEVGRIVEGRTIGKSGSSENQLYLQVFVYDDHQDKKPLPYPVTMLKKFIL